ncbi:MAG: aminotransferase class I/II-fold pyridoxal phosphate-dependent enzyme, partial [Aliiglaciecola sp.]|uniref:aminotransferase class I/II-fold pyridoxal phosphate-dependent enzyme n=1 Tax=Aliiglaciecola sp. TaxID=1872441 RepID=UPI003299B1A0
MKIPASIEIAQKARELEVKGVKIINLSVGQPDFKAPINQKTLRKVLNSSNHSEYSSSYGTSELRKLISTLVNKKHNLSSSPSNVVVTPGAKLGLLYAINAVCPKDSEVIIPEPCWMSYKEICEYSGVHVKSISGKQECKFIPTLDEILNKITSATSAIIICNPVNPSGVCWPKTTLKN